MDTEYLQSYITLLDLGSFSAAADELYLTSPALQKRVKHLENELSLQLIERTPKGVVPTKAGLEFYDGARRILGTVEQATQDAETAAQSATRTIRFGMGKHATPNILAELCWRFRAHDRATQQIFVPYPFGRWPQGLSIGLFDLCEYIGDQEEELQAADIELLPMRIDRVVALVLPDDELAGRETASLDDLAGRRLHLPESMDWGRSLMRRLGTESEALIVQPQEFSQLALLESSMRGDVTLMPESYVMRNYPFVGVPLEGDFAIPLGLAYRTPASEAVGAFVQFAKEYAASARRDDDR